MYDFIINPQSRSGAGRRIWQELAISLNKRRIPHRAHLTEYRGHARRLAAALSDTTEERTIVVLGGDGTINEVIDGLHLSENLTFGCIPTGSGNDFAKCLEIPVNPHEALACILEGRAYKRIRLGLLTSKGRTHRFAVSTGLGYDAAICLENLVSPWKKQLNQLGLGKLSYAAIGLKQLFLLKPHPLVLELDGKRRYTFPRACLTTVMNMPYEGGGLKFCPKADPGDGLLDICVGNAIPKWQLPLPLLLAFFGLHTRFPGIHTFRCRSAKISCPTPLPVHRDGESGGYQTNLIINLDLPALKVLVPVI